MSHASALNADRRARDLTDLADGEPFDVLIVGGGVTGAGAALDAATRGLRVALVERHDLGWGTSRWSSKLIHGGLRYLAQGSPGLALESARERAVLLRTASHLVRPITQVTPFGPGVDPGVARMTRVGVGFGDVLRRAAGTSARDLPRARRVTTEDVLELAPGVRRAGLDGGLVAWDAQVEDDARLVLALARTAAAHGARIVTRCAAEELAGDGARLRDLVAGAAVDVRASVVLNATGVWAGELAPGLRLRPSRGSHLVVPLDRLGGLAGTLNVPVPGERNRWVFAVAQRNGLAYVGLTDEAVDGPIPDVPTVPEPDVDFLLDTLSPVLERPLTRADVVGSFAGLRPLVDGGGARTADLSRKHVVVRGKGGLISVVGGKLTTYRRVAEDAIDIAVETAGLPARPCRTRRVALVGAAPRASLAAIPAPRRLVDRHGTEAPAVLALAGGDPELLAPIAPGLDVLHVEVLHAMRSEGALDVDDVLDRRTRIGLVPADRARALPVVEQLIGLGAQAKAA